VYFGGLPSSGLVKRERGGCETHGFALLGHSTVGTETSTMYTLPNLLRLGMVFLVLHWRHGR